MTKQLERLPRIRRVRPGDGALTLVIDWVGGGRDTVDLTGVIARFSPFAPLADPAVFATARPVFRGTGIGWENGLDYSGSNLALLAEEQRPMDAAELAAWQEHCELSNREAAEAIGLAPRTYSYYRGGRAIPKSVAAFVRAMARDPVVLGAHFRPAPPAGRPRKLDAA